MQDKLTDKQAIVLPGARQFKRIACCGLCLILAACATPGPDRQESPESGAEAPAAESGSDADALFHIAEAERLVGMGEYEEGLAQYLEAARVSNDPEVVRQVARLAARLGDWWTVMEVAERWLVLAPDDEDAQHIRILALLNTGQEQAAVDALSDLLEHGAEPAHGWRRAAVLVSAAEHPGVAEAVFSKLVARAGNGVARSRIEHAESVMLWQLGKDEAALEKALSAARESGQQEHRVWAAQLAAGNDKLELALEIYRQARATAPGEIELGLAEAEVLRQLERGEEALEVLRGLPPGSESLYTLGLYLAEQDRIEEAEDAWQQLAALEVDERDEQHAFLVAQLAELLDRNDAAREWYRRVGDGPKRQQALLRQAVLAGTSGDLETARRLLDELRLEGDADLVRETWLVESELLREAGRPEQAVEVLGQPLRESPGSIGLLYARALSAAAAGDIDLAEQDLRRIIQMDGSNSMALNALGYTLTDQTDRHQEAYRLIKRALELDPEDPATLDSMGWVLYRMDRAEEALGYLELALEGEDNAEIAAHLIEVLWYLERYDEAREHIERALEKYPDDPYLISTLERLGLSA